MASSYTTISRVRVALEVPTIRIQLGARSMKDMVIINDDRTTMFWQLQFHGKHRYRHGIRKSKPSHHEVIYGVTSDNVLPLLPTQVSTVLSRITSIVKLITSCQASATAGLQIVSPAQACSAPLNPKHVHMRTRISTDSGVRQDKMTIA